MKHRKRRDLLGEDSPLDRPLRVTFFDDIAGKSLWTETHSTRQFAALVENTVRPSKEDLLKVKLAQFGKHRSAKGSLRHDANLVSFDAIELDYDGGKVPIQEARDKFEAAGIAALLFQTPSSTAKEPRWRAILPCSRSMPPEDRERLVARANGVLGGILAGESFSSSQFYYAGTVRGKRPKVLLVDGRYIDEAHDLDAGAIGKRKKDREAKTEQRENDDTGNGAAFRKAMQLHLNGGTLEDFAEWAADNTWTDYERNPERAVERTWERAAIEAGRIALEQKHDDLGFEDLGNNKGAAKGSFIDELNKAHAVVRTGGKTVIADIKDSGVEFGSVSDLHTLYANRRAANAAGRSVPISELWLQHKNRRTYEAGVEFDPSGKCGPDTLNLWTGFAVEPNPAGSCELIKQHIHRVIAKGNRDHAAYIMGWLAHMVQRPGEKPGVAVVLRGKRGAGKDTVAVVMSKIIGSKHFPTVYDKNQLVGRFNAHFETALGLHVQEAVWAGDRQAESPLKALVTSETIPIERKGIDVINIKSVMRVFMSTNEHWAVPAAADERRWAVFNVSERYSYDKKEENKAHFDPLYAEINGDGPGAFLHFLQHYDLDGYDVRKPPDTEGLLDQKLASLRDFERYWLNVLRTGRVADSHDWEGGEVTIIVSDLVEEYNLHAKEKRFGAEHLDERAIGHKLREWCPDIIRKRGKRPARLWAYHLPDLDSCRAAFDKRIGGKVDWDE